jgi:hypothetical protein
MPFLIQLIDLITSNTVTLVATSVLALAIVGLVLVACWPSSEKAGRAAQPSAASSRSLTARALAAAGTPALEIARQTGLSRDALALVLAGKATRQNSPRPARSSLFARFRRSSTSTAAVA